MQLKFRHLPLTPGIKRGISLALAIVLAVFPFLKPAQAYPSNYGDWDKDYAVDLVEKYEVLKQEQLELLEKDDPATVETVLLLAVNTHDHLTGKSIKGSLESRAMDFGLCLDGIDLSDHITRGKFAEVLYKTAVPGDMLFMNVVTDDIIPDVKQGHRYYDAIYQCYRWGLMQGCDAAGSFVPDGTISNELVMMVMDRVLNPNLRASIALYGQDEVKIQADQYPLSYDNNTKGIHITVDKVRHYDTDCYIAHVILPDPAHIKTIYSDREWNDLGMEASLISEKLHSILMINGDFRNAEFGKDLGIIRNHRIVNDKLVSGLVMDMEGNLDIVTKVAAKTLLEQGIRETWTFGPQLVKTGHAMSSGSDARAPRTFVGQKYHEDGLLEYFWVVADGRTEWNAGLTMQQCGNIMEELGVDIAYNLDGGGSSVMSFMGETLNEPCYGERADIDYIYIK